MSVVVASADRSHELTAVNDMPRVDSVAASLSASLLPDGLHALARQSTAARERWREQSVLVRCMGDDNGGWGTDAQYRAAASTRDALWRAYERAWAIFARAFNAHVGSAVLDPERAR